MTARPANDMTSCPRCSTPANVPLSAALATCGQCGNQWKAEPHELPVRRQFGSAHVYDGPEERIFFSIPDELDLQALKEVWDEALCAQVDPELFFPEKGHSSDKAREICAKCPVRAQCLEVFGDVIDYGVVGGLTEPERRALRGRSRKEAA